MNIVINKYYRFLKRLMDITISGVLMIMLLPVFLILTILVPITSSGPALFWSKRTGYNGKSFLMPKFRTMTTCSKIVSRETASVYEITLTSFGKALRKTSLDELPQLWCVFIGKMSLVGPRPVLVNDQTNKLRHKYPKIFEVKPGLSGLAQVNGRNYISIRNKIRYDTFYAERMCLILDLKIIYKTFGTIFNHKLVQ